MKNSTMFLIVKYFIPLLINIRSITWMEFMYTVVLPSVLVRVLVCDKLGI